MSTDQSAPMTADERGKLNEQIRLAQQFEQQEDIALMKQPLEGILQKFTNAFQGYQDRWFVLDPPRAELSYYLKEEHRHTKRHRGVLNLNGSTIIPSEEDSLAFTVCPAIGEPTYRLRAADTKQKTQWINRMRIASEEQRERRLRDALREHVKTPAIADPVRHGVAREAAVLHNVYKVLTAMSEQLRALNRNIDALPESELNGRLDPNVLTLRALAQATFSSVEHSWTALNELQLPLYKKEEEGNIFVPDPPLILEPYVEDARRTVEPAYNTVRDGVSSMGKISNCAAEAAKKLQHYFTDENQSAIPKAVAITLGGMGGFLVGMRRGGIVRRVVYSGLGMVLVASFCYPNETMDIGRTTVKNIQQQWDEFVASPPPPGKEKGTK